MEFDFKKIASFFFAPIIGVITLVYEYIDLIDFSSISTYIYSVSSLLFIFLSRIIFRLYTEYETRRVIEEIYKRESLKNKINDDIELEISIDELIKGDKITKDTTTSEKTNND